jgi:hypothetical protein
MPTLTPAYGTAVALTVTNLHSLANNAWWASGAIDQDGTDDAMDAVLGGVFKTHASSAPTDGAPVDVYVAAQWDTGANDFQAGIGTGLPGEGTKTEGTHFMQENLILAASVIVPASTGVEVKWSAGSVAALFGGVMPVGWCVVVQNRSGQALAADTNEITYVPVKYESA